MAPHMGCVGHLAYAAKGLMTQKKTGATIPLTIQTHLSTPYYLKVEKHQIVQIEEKQSVEFSLSDEDTKEIANIIFMVLNESQSKFESI